MKLRPAVEAIILFVASVPAAAESPCTRGAHSKVTDDFFFSISSDQGAVGDVVPVELSLTMTGSRDRLAGLSCVACYDPSILELLPQPEFTPLFDELAYISNFVTLGDRPVGPQSPSGRTGFYLGADFLRTPADTLLTRGNTIPLGTLYFRIKGQPGDVSTISFCDGVFVHRTESCLDNWLYSIHTTEDQVVGRSTLHESGTIKVLSGSPTQTAPPSLPPDSKVYPTAPAQGEANIEFELSSGVAAPGSVETPMHLYLTSNFEFSGFSVALTFPPSYLELVDVQQFTRPGAQYRDNSKGEFGLYMQNSTRRVGGEGERVHIATLYFNVKQAASEVSEVPVSFQRVGGFTNWIGIRSGNGGLGTDQLPVTTTVEPLVIDSAGLRIQNQATNPGDVNLDYQVDVSDAMGVLDMLFLGGQAVDCPQAADFNDDSLINISDPIAILDYLFFGKGGLESRSIWCQSTSDF